MFMHYLYQLSPNYSLANFLHPVASQMCLCVCLCGCLLFEQHVRQSTFVASSNSRSSFFAIFIVFHLPIQKLILSLFLEFVEFFGNVQKIFEDCCFCKSAKKTEIRTIDNKNRILPCNVHIA